MPYNLFHETRSIEYTKIIQKVIRTSIIITILLAIICLLFIDPTIFESVVLFLEFNLFILFFSLISQLKLWWTYGKNNYTISVNTTNQILFQSLFWSLLGLFSFTLYHTERFNLIHFIILSVIFSPYYYYIHTLK